MQWAHIPPWTLHCLGHLAASLKAKDTYSDSQRRENHSTYYCLKTILLLCYVVSLGHSAVLPITQYINPGAAESNTIGNKSQPTKRQVKQISLQCSIYVESGRRGVLQILKAHIHKPKHRQKQSQSTALTPTRLVEAHNAVSHRGELLYHKQCSRAVLTPGGTTPWTMDPGAPTPEQSSAPWSSPELKQTLHLLVGSGVA